MEISTAEMLEDRNIARTGVKPEILLLSKTLQSYVCIDVNSNHMKQVFLDAIGSIMPFVLANVDYECVSG